MRVKLLIATVDIIYAGQLADNISEFHADKIDVSICSTLDGMQEALSKRKYNVALMDLEMINYLDTSCIHLPMLLWSENEDTEDTNDLPDEFERIRKHQRISSIVAIILERYAKISGGSFSPGSGQANITTVWAPAGGVGKTTVALAYALANVSEGKDVFYLNLENFSSVPGCFNETGKSISRVFEMLENHDGNVKMLVQGISCRDSGITYLCGPENFDDMCILTDENVNEVITTCSELTNELVIDLSCIYDTRTRMAFELADKILIVTDMTVAAEVKLAQFISQNNVYEGIKEKVTFVVNKAAAIGEQFTDSVFSLPLIQSNDMISVYKKLSENQLLFKD